MLKSYSNILYKRHVFAFSTSSHLAEKWDLITAVCLERKPVITRPMTKLETEYKNYLQQVELERSLKSDHELRHEKEVKQLEQLKKGGDADIPLKETAQDFVDANTEELNKFQFASRDSEADIKSLNRKLDRHLVLVTKQKLGSDSLYLLPQAKWQDGESLRQTAERILKTDFGTDLKAMIYSNAPSAFYKYKYPKSVRNDDAVGAKVFIYFARYLKGPLPEKSVDYKWLDRTELREILPQKYGYSVQQMLIDE